MSVPRFHCPPPILPDHPLQLPPAVAHHAVRVLRLTRGADVVLFDGSGAEYPAQLTAVERHTVEALPRAARWPQVESPLRLHLGQGLSASDKFDLVLQKAVELGIAEFTPLALRRSVVKVEGERAARRRMHWQGIAVGACEQSGRVRLPTLHPVMRLSGWLAALPGDILRLRLAPEAHRGLRELPPGQAGAALAIGPEGGFAPDEVALLETAGFVGVSLGPRILRTETAALAALSALQAWYGDLGNSTL